jgi:hypothetical protein
MKKTTTWIALRNGGTDLVIRNLQNLDRSDLWLDNFDHQQIVHCIALKLCYQIHILESDGS